MEFEGMKPQHEGPIAEVAGTPIVGIPLSEDQAYRLHEVIDPEIDRLIAGLEMERVRRELSDSYQRRTLPELH